MQEHQYSPEALEPCRRTAEKLLEQAAERLLGAPQTAPEPVQVNFDWDPVVIDGCVTFHSQVSRGKSRQSIVNFTINLKKLTETQQEQLANFHVRRGAGINDAYDLSWHLSWLVETWLTQVQPELIREDRRTKVREVLLFSR